MKESKRTRRRRVGEGESEKVSRRRGGQGRGGDVEKTDLFVSCEDESAEVCLELVYGSARLGNVG